MAQEKPFSRQHLILYYIYKYITLKNKPTIVLWILLTKLVAFLVNSVVITPGCNALVVTFVSFNLLANATVNNKLHNLVREYVFELTNSLLPTGATFNFSKFRLTNFAAFDETLTIRLGADCFNLSRKY